MDGETLIPLSWLIGLGGAGLGAFIYWLKSEFARNWREHDNMTKSAEAAHKEIDIRIDSHHEKIDGHIEKIHRRIDWMIQNTIPHAPYPEERDRE